MIVRMRLRKWEDAFECKTLGLNIQVKGSESIGFLEVYPSVESLHKEYPGEIHYLEIQEQK